MCQEHVGPQLLRESNLKYLLLVSGLVLGMVAMQPLRAFESPEHEVLGNMAIKAVILLECEQAQTACEQQDQACEQRKLDKAQTCTALHGMDAESTKLHYGEVVACVDYFLTPEKLMARYDESSSHLIGTWPSEDHCNNKQNGKWAQASHANHTHFQKELLVSLSTYHQLAVSLARDRSRLGGALFVNAIGDHYLQDFFAPGHITVRRSQMTDLFANAMHDAANEKGATFHPGEGSGVQRMNDTIRDIKAAIAARTEPVNVAPENAGSENIGPQKKDAYRKALVTALRAFLAGDAGCPGAADAMPADGIRLEGDGLLGRGDGCAQRLLMLAANVISIEDVLQATQNVQPENYYDEYALSLRPGIYASLPFGYYALGADGRASNQNDRDLPHARDQVWTFNASKDLFYDAGKGGARSVILMEAVPRVWIGPGENTALNFGIAMGLHAFEWDDKKPWSGQKENGVGGTFRSTVIFPETETAFSLLLQRTYHGGASVGDWGNGWNLRVEQGFTSFLTFFLGWGGDAMADAPGQLGYGHYTTAGVMIAGPVGRIKKLFK